MKKRILSLVIIIATILSTNIGVFADSYNTLGETPSGIPFTKLEAEIDKYMEKYIGESSPGAAIAIVKDGKIILSKGYGYGDLEQKKLVDPKTTTFEWGSISKLFTWTSAMQLYEKGQLDLDADIREYLADDFVAKLKYNQPISMLNMMNHSTGFGDYSFDLIDYSPDDVISIEDAILLANPSQYYEVGTSSAYSNYSTALAGYVVEQISNKTYHDYQMEKIFNILDMKNTSADPKLLDNPSIIETKAKGYIANLEEGFTKGTWSYVSLAPAGAINGTVEDLAKFAIALTPAENEKSPLFDSRATLDEMFTTTYPQTSHGFFEFYGKSRSLGHGGNTAAFTGQFCVVPEERFGAVILTNTGAEYNITLGLQNLLIGQKSVEETESNIELPSSKAVEGKYVPQQRNEGNFLDLVTYIGIYKITATDKDEIVLEIGPYNGTYRQLAPHHYEIIDEDLPIFSAIYPILDFKIENDKVEQIVAGHGMNLTALPSDRTVIMQSISMGVILISILFFTISIFVAIFSRIRKKKEERSISKLQKINQTIIALGIATIINNVICISRIMADHLRSFAEMKPHLLTNYALLIAVIVTVIYGVKEIQKPEVKRKSKIIFSTSIIITAALFTVLKLWNFFALVG